LTFELDQLIVLFKKLFHRDNLDGVGLLHFGDEGFAHEHLLDRGLGLELALDVTLHLLFFLDFFF
jgi:hypothetical protein